jgi:hypothetical protein
MGRASDPKLWVWSTAPDNANRLARIFVITFTQRIFIVDSFDDWPQRIAAYLHGRTQAFGMDIVRGALGLRYGDMDVPAWRRVAAGVMAAGWRKGRLEGVPCWIAPAAG